MRASLTLNPCRSGGGTMDLPEGIPYPSDDATPPTLLLRQCPAAAETPLSAAPDLARRAGVAELWVKDERNRMGLGSFKALGAAHVIAQAAVATGAEGPEALSRALDGQTYITASAGNHGLSVAAGARIFGARSVVYLADTVPDSFAQRLKRAGAEVVRAGQNYAESMDAAAETAEAKGWTLLSDSSWPGYTELPWVLMQGYLVLMEEAVAQIPSPPSHVFVQAGVGGLAAAVAASARKHWGDDPVIVVVEPSAAACIAASLASGTFAVGDGPTSIMGRLDCKEASMIALKGLARDADAVLTVTDAEVADEMDALSAAGLAATPSAAAGIVALLHADDSARSALELNAESRVLCFLSEEPE